MELHQKLIVISWIAFGLLGTWRMYHGLLKEWYEEFQESYWDFDKRENDSYIRTFLYFSPLYILGGLISFMYSFSDKNTGCWYFSTKPNKIVIFYYNLKSKIYLINNYKKIKEKYSVYNKDEDW